jgi:GH25 family lysozyme M1 (1,4-beta-N-acetylmuramidase)
MKALRRVGALLRRHKHAEEAAAEAVGLNILWTVLRTAGLFGAGIASAAVLAPDLVDLSNNNGPAAASAISAPGVKAVEAKGTEGLAFRDRDYPIFRVSAAKHRRAFGGYMFLHPGESGRAQARYFLAYAKPRPGDIEPVVDSETGSPSVAASATYAALHELALHGYRPILYASSSYLQGLVSADPRIKRYRAWQAEYGPVLHRVAGVTTVAWQFTDRARVLGFSVDGSHLLVRSIVQIEIRKPHAAKPPSKPVTTTTPAKPKVVRVAAAKLRARTGYWSWLAWRLGEGAWRDYRPATATVRPRVRAAVPSVWWRNERAFTRARKA